jgi:hypothetical protein
VPAHRELDADPLRPIMASPGRCCLPSPLVINPAI